MQPCTDWIEIMNAVLDGEAAPAQQAALAAHMEQCPACKALYADLKSLREGSDSLLVRAPDTFKADVMARIAAEDAAQGRSASRPAKKHAARWRSWAAMAAVFALVIGVGARQSLPLSRSAAPAAQDSTLSAENPRSGDIAMPEQEHDPAPQSSEPSYGTQVQDTESAASEPTAKSSQSLSASDSAQNDDLIALRAAMELVVEHICGERGYQAETEYTLYLHGLAPYCDFRLLDGETVTEEGRVTFTGLSPNEQFYCFARTWEGQSEEDALLFRYAVPTDGGEVRWAGDSTGADQFDRMLCE